MKYTGKSPKLGIWSVEASDCVKNIWPVVFDKGSYVDKAKVYTLVVDTLRVRLFKDNLFVWFYIRFIKQV